MKRSLEGLLGRVEESDEGMIWGPGREKVGGWMGCWEGLMVLAEVSLGLWYQPKSGGWSKVPALSIGGKGKGGTYTENGYCGSSEMRSRRRVDPGIYSSRLDLPLRRQGNPCLGMPR